MSGLRNDQSGISLVELIVAIALTAIVSTLLVSIVVSVSRAVTRESQSTSNAEWASLGMRELTRVVRSGTEIEVRDAANLPAFRAAGSAGLELYAFVDADAAAPEPIRVRFQVTASGVLMETRWTASADADGYWEFATTAQPARTIVRGVATPLFRYFDAAGVELLVPASGELTTAQLSVIAAVQIHLNVQVNNTGSGAEAVLENTVGIPNLGVSRVGAVG